MFLLLNFCLFSRFRYECCLTQLIERVLQNIKPFTLKKLQTHFVCFLNVLLLNILHRLCIG